MVILVQKSVFWTGGATTDTMTTSFELTVKETLYRDALARALAKRNESLPASKRMKVSTEHSSKDVYVDEGVKRNFIL